MFRLFAIFVPLVGLTLFAGGCCCVGPACSPCGVSYDSCCDTGCDSCCESECGDCCDMDCGPSCGPCEPSCGVPCFCLPNPLHWVGGLFHRACYCDCGCGEVYWGSWWSDPPCYEPCDPCGNWAGCDSGCYGRQTCGPCGGGCAMPEGQCDDCVQTAGIPRGAKIVSRSDERMVTPSNIEPRRAPVKATPVKKSPQANRFYKMQMRR